MTKAELQKREAIRRKKIIEKARLKNEKKREARIATEEERYKKFREDALLKLNQKRDRKRMHRKNKITKLYKNKTTDATKKARKQIVVKRIPTTIRSKAIVEVQKRAKLSKTDNLWTLILADNGRRVHWTDAVGGHYFSKWQYPHLVFNLHNIQPITNETNRIQGSEIGYTWKDWLIKAIGQENYELLVQQSKDKSLKNQLRSREEYQQIYDTFRSLNKERQKQLWKFYKKY